MTDTSSPIAQLRRIMQQLRDPQQGCPWDLVQTMPSLVKYTLEEAYEVADAILQEEPDAICEELGDLLFQVVFYAQLADEQGWFSLDDVAQGICDKLIRRHPHVFSERAGQMSAEEVAQQWQLIKAEEKRQKGDVSPSSNSVLAHLERGKPALMRAVDIQTACAKVGFDWPSAEPVLEKVREELDELKDEMSATAPDPRRQSEEFGDLMFAMVNLARHLNIEPESALRDANHKFERRFTQVEQLAAKQQRSVDRLSLDALEGLWQQVKANERS